MCRIAGWVVGKRKVYSVLALIYGLRWGWRGSNICDIWTSACGASEGDAGDVMVGQAEGHRDTRLPSEVPETRGNGADREILTADDVDHPRSSCRVNGQLSGRSFRHHSHFPS